MSKRLEPLLQDVKPWYGKGLGDYFRSALGFGGLGVSEAEGPGGSDPYSRGALGYSFKGNVRYRVYCDLGEQQGPSASQYFAQITYYRKRLYTNGPGYVSESLFKKQHTSYTDRMSYDEITAHMVDLADKARKEYESEKFGRVARRAAAGAALLYMFAGAVDNPREEEVTPEEPADKTEQQNPWIKPIQILDPE